MTKAELTSENAPAAIRLKTLCQQIRAYHESVEIRLKRLKREANDTVTDAALAGKALIAAKAAVEFGSWMDWVEENLPTIGYRRANAYMRVANFWERIKEIDQSESLRAAMLLCYEEKNGIKCEPKHWPVYVEACNRFSKFVNSHPVGEWEEEQRQLLRENVEPVARVLWPERWK